MTKITTANDKSRAEERQVAASTCLTQYLYNIPPGVITVISPGLSILIIGVVLLALSTTAISQSNVADGLPLLAVVTVAVGGVWTLLAVGFTVTVCCYRRQGASSKTSTSQNIVGTRSSVELVAVSWRDDALHSYGFQDISLDQIHYYN